MLLSRKCWPLAAVLLSLCAPTAAFGQWSERTELTFSEPVIIPGATLQPGTYVFQLLEPGSAGDTLEIRREDGTLVTTTMTVPARRTEAKEDNVLKFNPTEEGTPPALAAWFYPGTIYGHQFVYPEEQARKIAQRTKTVVLSTDVPGTDLEKGQIRVFDATGTPKAWTPDPEAMASWQKWSEDRRATAHVATETAEGERARAMAPAVDADFQGMRVELDQIEDNPSIYVGKTVSVDGEVEDVYGPRIFTIDERNWADFDGELLVLVPSPMAALVREDHQVTVTGTVKPFVEADFEREWGWPGIDDDAEVELPRRPVLVASRIVGGSNDTVLVMNTRAEPQPVGTSGTTATTGGSMGTLTAISAIADADETMVGRSVDLDEVEVRGTARDRGFFADAGDHTIFVLPMADAGAASGQTLSIEGVVMEMPRHMRDTLHAPSGDFNDDIYIYATKVSR